MTFDFERDFSGCPPSLVGEARVDLHRLCPTPLQYMRSFSMYLESHDMRKLFRASRYILVFGLALTPYDDCVLTVGVSVASVLGASTGKMFSWETRFHKVRLEASFPIHQFMPHRMSKGAARIQVRRSQQPADEAEESKKLVYLSLIDR
jgi:hypothetical protein